MNENNGWTVIRQRASGREKDEQQQQKKNIAVDFDNMHTHVYPSAVTLYHNNVLSSLCHRFRMDF